MDRRPSGEASIAMNRSGPRVLVGQLRCNHRKLSVSYWHYASQQVGANSRCFHVYNIARRLVTVTSYVPRVAGN